MFDLIGKGLAAMHEDSAKKPDLDLDALEKLAAQATPGPWETKLIDNPYYFGGRPLWKLTVDGCFVGELHQPYANEIDAAYIVAACNAVPELIAENRALQERAQMRQELVEQYEKDIARLRQKMRELERQNDFFLKALKENFVCPYSRCKYDDGGSELNEWECNAENNRECWIKAAKEAGE